MTPKTEDEILTHYILSQGMDPENDEVREIWKGTYGYAAYNLSVRVDELKKVINQALNKIFPVN